MILPVSVRRNITLAEAPSYGKTIFEYDPSCHGAADYLKVAQLIATEEGKNFSATENTEVTEKLPIKIIEVGTTNLQTKSSDQIQTVPGIPPSETKTTDNHKIL
jgi:nitrogenase subunit NifH